MSLLLNWRVWVLLALLALVPISYLKGRNDGRKLERLEYAAGVASANAEALRLERARQSRADDAGRLAAARAADDLNRAARVRTADGRVLDALRTANERGAQSLEACREHTAALEAVFGECRTELRQMGEAAAGHASDSLKLQESWPTDPPP